MSKYTVLLQTIRFTILYYGLLILVTKWILDTNNFTLYTTDSLTGSWLLLKDCCKTDWVGFVEVSRPFYMVGLASGSTQDQLSRLGLLLVSPCPKNSQQFLCKFFSSLKKKFVQVKANNIFVSKMFRKVPKYSNSDPL